MRSQLAKWKDVWWLAVMVVSLCSILMAFVSLPSLPFHGESAQQVAQIVRESMRSEVDNASMPSDDSDTSSVEIAARWRQFGEETQAPEAKAALETARHRFAERTWPIALRPAYVGEKKCWVVVSSWRATLRQTGYFCGNTSAAEIREMRSDGNDRNTEIAVVEAGNSAQLLFHSPRRAQEGLG